MYKSRYTFFTLTAILYCLGQTPLTLYAASDANEDGVIKTALKTVGASGANIYK